MSTAETQPSTHQNYLTKYQAKENIAYDLVSRLHKLYTEKDVTVKWFGDSLNGVAPVDILTKIEQSAERFPVNNEFLNIEQLLDLVVQITDDVSVRTASVDAGQLLSNDISLATALAKVNSQIAANSSPVDVVLYGFGRIGRILTRLLLEEAISPNGLQLRAIVVRPGKAGDIAKRASLLKRDSVHGTFSGSVTVDETNQGLIVNGRFIQMIYANSPSEIDYTAYGIDDALVIDNTGIWKDEEGLGQHLKSKGVKKVLLTAPAQGNIKNVVFGVNSDTVGDDVIVSAASCTTNAITPSLNVLHDKYGIENGHVETIHSFTNDQNLIDNHHKSDRRGRSAVLNMVITSTGAAKAVGKALPELDGKLTGNAIRVPTPNVSLAILNLNLKTAPESVESLNAFLREVSNTSQWQSQIAYSDSNEAVSTDFIGTKHVGIIDALATIVTNNNATVYIWYDNEVGYSTQVLRLASQMAGIQYTEING